MGSSNIGATIIAHDGHRPIHFLSSIAIGMAAAGPAIKDADAAGAMAAIGRNVVSSPVKPMQVTDLVAQLQETVRHQQSHFDAQGGRLHCLENVLAQLSVS